MLVVLKIKRESNVTAQGIGSLHKELGTMYKESDNIYETLNNFFRSENENREKIRYYYRHGTESYCKGLKIVHWKKVILISRQVFIEEE